MSEELLKAIIQLFAIVARERITDDERANITEFLRLHLNRDAIKYYLNLFDEFCKAGEANVRFDNDVMDSETQQFVDDWSRIMGIVKQVNQALTRQQKLVLVTKIIELVFADYNISERQANLIYYIGQALKLPKEDVLALQYFVMGQDIDELASKDILIIDEGSGDTAYPGPRIVEKNLTGLIAILRLADGETYFIKYLGISTLYLNSIPFKSRRIDIFPTGSTIRGNKIEPIYYSDIVGKFLVDESKATITFTADHIFYHFRTGKAALLNINIAEHGGKLIGLMGASGSGKSTLLSILTGIEKPSSGRVFINGIDIHKNPDEVQGVIGYIPQDDLLIEDLTVFENLYYAARLCFAHYSVADINIVCERVLINLGLAEIRNLKVGSIFKKTISGGQRKRLNIGLELLREPTVLFVDEPTSGLSSSDSENIMDLLKELSLRGKMVFVVIHQPSSDIFKLFDQLIIMDIGGFQIYYGNPVEAVYYFREMIHATNKNQGVCPECGNVNPEQVFDIIETKIVNEYGRLTDKRKISPGQWYQYFKQKIKIPLITHVKEELPVVQEIPNWYKQFNVFINRDLLSKVANKQYLLINLIEAPVLAFFVSFMVKYYNILENSGSGYTFYSNPNIPVYFFVSVVIALFLGLTMSAEEIYRDRKILKRERFLHLNRSSYLLAKIAIMFLISAVQTISFILIANYVLEIPLTELRYWFILFSCSCFANLLGLNISASFNSAVTIYILIPLLVIPQLLLSGVVISFDKFNPRVSRPIGVPLMGNLMASRWAYEAFMVTQFRDNPFEKQFYELDKEVANATFKRIYYLPELKSKLAYCVSLPKHWENIHDNKMVYTLDLLRAEIKSELDLVGIDKFPEWAKLVPDKFDPTVADKALKFLNILNEYYSIKLAKASTEKEARIKKITTTAEDAEAYRILKRKYVNDAVSAAVENTTSPERIVEFNGLLNQKIYPIYMDKHKPRSLVDFSANMFQPTKHFLGYSFNTLYFNVAVIWIMTLFLYVSLYFDLLKKLIKAIEGSQKHRRKERL